MAKKQQKESYWFGGNVQLDVSDSGYGGDEPIRLEFGQEIDASYLVFVSTDEMRKLSRWLIEIADKLDSSNTALAAP
jgi:hypothetical protein